MSRGPEASHLPLGPEKFRTYLWPNTNPPLDVNALSLDLLQGTQRKGLRVLTDGDWSLLLSYRRKEAYVASFTETDEHQDRSLRMTQLQGATRGAGYRVISGMDVLGLFTDQIRTIAEDSVNNYGRLMVAPTILIEGIITATEAAIKRYEIAISKLGLRYSEEYESYIRELK